VAIPPFATRTGCVPAVTAASSVRHRVSTGVKHYPCIGDRRNKLHRTEFQCRAHRHDNPSCAQDSVEDHRERSAIRQHRTDPIAWLQTTIDEVVGEARNIVRQH
jgi:hypothetical protein